jgi:nucleoside-diphosphate-sugar epimerase
MKLLVTGGLGHIGSKLIREFANYYPNCDVYVVDNLMTQRYCSLFNLPKNCSYHFYAESILNFDLINIIGKVDCVIHLAAITDAGMSVMNKDLVDENNFGITKKVSEYCAHYGAPLIFASTASVYGPKGDSVDEACAPIDINPQSPYAVTKLKEEKFIIEAYQNKKYPMVICRLGTIFGVSPGIRFHTAVNKFCWQASLSLPISVWKTALNQRRPYLDLVDCIEGFYFIIQNNLFNGQIYNFVTQNYTVKDIVDTIKSFKNELKIELVDSPIMNELSYSVSTEKIKKLGFSFKGELKKQIHETLSLLDSLSKN